MWTYRVHWGFAHGAFSEATSVGWGWYVVVLSVAACLFIAMRKS